MLQKLVYGCQRLFVFFLFGICFLLPFEPKFLATVEIFAVLFFLLGHSPITIFSNLKKQPAVLPYFLFFGLTCLSYFYSDDKTEAGRQIEVKLPFLIIPLLLWGSGLSKKNAKTALIVFLSGCACACLVLLARATWTYAHTGDSNVFVYTEFSRFMHVSYFSLYLLVCFGWFFMLMLEDTLFFPKLHYLLMGLFAVCLVLISAKIMLLAFVGAAFLFAGYYARRTKRVLKAVWLMLALLALPVTLYLASANVRMRVDAIVQEVNNRNAYTAPQNMGSTTTRLVIWRDALPQIKQNLPWGVGAGDVKNLLVENYRKRDMQLAIERKFNMHNEYLQLLAGMGIPGLLLFIILLLLPAFLCSPPHRFIGLFFTFTVATVSLTESILERQAGTIFLCLLGVLFMVLYRKEAPPVPNS